MCPIPQSQVSGQEATPFDIKSLFPSFFMFEKKKEEKKLEASHTIFRLFLCFLCCLLYFHSNNNNFFFPPLYLPSTSSNLMSDGYIFFHLLNFFHLLPRTPEFFYMHNNFPSFMMTVENAFTLLKRENLVKCN